MNAYTNIILPVENDFALDEDFDDSRVASLGGDQQRTVSCLNSHDKEKPLVDDDGDSSLAHLVLEVWRCLQIEKQFHNTEVSLSTGLE